MHGSVFVFNSVIALAFRHLTPTTTSNRIVRCVVRIQGQSPDLRIIRRGRLGGARDILPVIEAHTIRYYDNSTAAKITRNLFTTVAVNFEGGGTVM